MSPGCTLSILVRRQPVYTMPNLRAWLTRTILHGHRPARRGAVPNRFRLTDGALEDRLPPGDVLFTGLFGLAPAAGGYADAGQPGDPLGAAARPPRAGQIADA